MKFDMSSRGAWLRCVARLATVIALVQYATAFTPGSKVPWLGVAVASGSSKAGDLAMVLPGSTGDENQPLASIANGIKNIFAPLNEGKKALVRAFAGPYNRDIIRSRLDKLIQEKPVLMLSFTTCPYCLKAKSVLNEVGAKYEVIELDKYEDGGPIRAELADMVGRTSVPAIWIGQTFIGGCNDGPMGGIVKLNESGKLIIMLKEVGAF